MKKLINDARNVVPEMLEGLALTHPDIALLDGEHVALQAERPPTGVAVVSGGGAGHEPAHAGYVGAGMLNAAVCGEVFTSPSVDAVLDTIRAVQTPEGVLLIIKNYTGDRLNFGLAAELARAEGIPVETVTVSDDVALDPDGAGSGPRGIAGTVLVHKVAGAAAAGGASLSQVAAEAAAVAESVGTMGVALDACTVPAAGRPGFELGAGEIELGLGIHGEAGVRRARLQHADRLVEALLERITATRRLAEGDRVALLVNGLGGTPPMELAIVARAAVLWLAEHGLILERAWTGAFLTALDMPGCSLSLLPVDDELLERLDAPTTAPAWPTQQLGRTAETVARVRNRTSRTPQRRSTDPATTVVRRPSPLHTAIHAVCDSILKAQDELTELDGRVGDGDLGDSMRRGAEETRRYLGEHSDNDATPASEIRGIADSVRRAMGGTSGPLYGVLLLRAAAVLDAGGPDPSPATWAEAFTAGTKAVAELGEADAGDRTMLDALQPAARALSEAIAEGMPAGAALRRMSEAARDGAAGTAALVPRRGRSSYLGERAIGHPDPGAVAVATWLEALCEALAP